MLYLEEFVKVKKIKKVLVVFPHPDDESVMAGGLIQVCLNLGLVVSVIILTKGNEGKIHIHPKGKSLKEVRKGEFFKAMKALRVVHYKIFDFGDGKLKHTKKWQSALKNNINEFSPDLVVGYDLSGVTGHPDHIALARKLFKIVRSSKVEMLVPRPVGLIRNIFESKKTRKFAINPTVRVRMSFVQVIRKFSAIMSHRSQGFGKWGVGLLVSFLMLPVEEFGRFDHKNKYYFRYIKFKI